MSDRATLNPTAPKVARDAEERGQGICRTCLAPIWNEGGTVGHRRRAEGWSDRIEQGGDSLVCFKAIEYRHVPLKGREAAIYDAAAARALDEAASWMQDGVGEPYNPSVTDYTQQRREASARRAWLRARAAVIRGRDVR